MAWVFNHYSLFNQSSVKIIIMGCIGSNIEAIELYSLLNEITKESIRNAIAEDDLPALASLEAETSSPLNT